MKSLLPSDELVLLNAATIAHSQEWNFKNVCSPFCRLYLIEEGEACLFIENKKQVLRTGYMYFIPAFQKHANQCDNRFVHTYIHVFNAGTSLSSILERYAIPLELPATPLDKQLFRRVLELHTHSKLTCPDPATYDNMQGLTSSLKKYNMLPSGIKYETHHLLSLLIAHFMHAAIPRMAVDDDRMLQVQKMILNDLSDVCLEKLAARISVSKDRLIRVFKKQFGTTPMQYIINKRIERAQIYLVLDKYSIKEIAVLTGFKSQSFFCVQFKKKTGLSPHAYRFQHK